MSPYYIFFSGGIGVGKTTSMTAMKVMMARKNYAIIKEYIDYHPNIGDTLLSKNKEGKLSDFEFQKYILDCYESQLSKITNEEIVFVERHPIEALEIFVKNSKNRMPYTLEKELEERIREMMVKYEIPEINECYLNKYNTSLFSIKAIIENLNNKIIDHLNFPREGKFGEICYLTAYTRDMMQRVNQRGRVSERDLDPTILAFIASKYESFYLSNKN